MSNLRKYFLLITLSSLILVNTGCAPKAEVKIQLIETLTSLESQVLGTYKQIGQEAWLISSVRGSQLDQRNISPSKKEVFAAIENQEFNADDIAEFKDDGVVGENSLGQLIIRETDRFTENVKYAELVKEIIFEENRDRLTIIKRIIMENPQLKESNLLVVQQAFANIFWQQATPEHWLITNENIWLQKKNWSAKSTSHAK